MGLAIRKIYSLAGKIIPADVKSTALKLTGAANKGYKISKRYNSIHDKSKISGAKTSAKSITKELGKLKFTRDEIPALAAAITYLIPIPSPIPLTPIVYGAGYGINKCLKLTGKILNRIF